MITSCRAGRVSITIRASLVSLGFEVPFPGACAADTPGRVVRVGLWVSGAGVRDWPGSPQSSRAVPTLRPLLIADLLLECLNYWGDFGLKDENLAYWLNPAKTNKLKAAREFWAAVHKGQAEAFAAGARSIPDILTPRQKRARRSKPANLAPCAAAM